MLESMTDMDVIALPSGVTRFAAWHLESAPWPNGGGITKEIASGKFPVQPHGVSVPWDWRLSIATIAKDGPFSSFFHVDRTAVLVEGAVSLKAHACELRLSEPGDFESFPGESSLIAEIKAGEPRLLNVMVQRERGCALVEVHRGSASIRPPVGSMTCLFVLSGVFRFTLSPKSSSRAGRCDLVADEGLRWGAFEARCGVEMVSDVGCLIQIAICPERPSC